jgi:hypothetical protein
MLNIALVISVLTTSNSLDLRHEEIIFIDNTDKELLYIEESNMLEERDVSDSFSEVGLLK